MAIMVQDILLLLRQKIVNESSFQLINKDLKVLIMNKIQIGDIVEIKASIVDYNEGSRKVKVRITGYGEDKRNFAERYL